MQTITWDNFSSERSTTSDEDAFATALLATTYAPTSFMCLTSTCPGSSLLQHF